MFKPNTSVDGPNRPFGHATDFAVAADQSGRPCEAQHFPDMDGSSVPQAVIQGTR
jgi:hypothetical protein